MLPTGAIVPSLTGHNVAQRDVVVRAIRGAIEELGGRPRRVALVVPDAAAKVSLLPFEQVPSNPRDLEQLLRLHLRKTVPFPVDEAQITWARGGALDGATTMIVTAMRRAIVEEYEAVCAAAGLHAGTVDIATFTGVDGYRDHVDRLIDGLKRLPRADGVGEILVPGEPEDRCAEERGRLGVPLPPGTVQNLRAVARRFGAKLPANL